MSKASEWSDGYSERPYIRFGYGPRGRVTDSGRCEISNGDDALVLLPEQALALARWILDTFGEPTG